MSNLTVAERLASGLERKPNGCLEWTRGTDEGGYGRIRVDGKNVATHRLAWGLAHPGEPLPPVMRHLVCDNPPCCDVAHLQPGTQADNVADRDTKGRAGVSHNGSKIHCPANHTYDEANTIVNRDGSRACKICAAARGAARNIDRRAKRPCDICGVVIGVGAIQRHQLRRHNAAGNEAS